MKVQVLVAMVMLAATMAVGGEGLWITDFAQAKQLAAEKNVPILADFSGSDWCGWCIRLDKEVFSQPEFQAYAKDKLVLFLADFPSRKKLPDDVVKQNQELQKQFKVEGYPTVILLDAQGNEKARTGYRPGGAAAYVEHLKALVGP